MGSFTLLIIINMPGSNKQHGMWMLNQVSITFINLAFSLFQSFHFLQFYQIYSILKHCLEVVNIKQLKFMLAKEFFFTDICIRSLHLCNFLLPIFI